MQEGRPLVHIKQLTGRLIAQSSHNESILTLKTPTKYFPFIETEVCRRLARDAKLFPGLPIQNSSDLDFNAAYRDYFTKVRAKKEEIVQIDHTPRINDSVRPIQRTRDRSGFA